MDEIPFAEVTSMFPLLEEREYEELKAHIEANGLLEPIWVHDGRIIDGRHRYRACLELGIEPVFWEWDGQGKSLIDVVWGLNEKRRQLTFRQRLDAAKKRLALEKEAAKTRQKAHGGTAPGRSLPDYSQGVSPPLSGNGSTGEALDQAAASAGFSGKSLRRFLKVEERGLPELTEMVLSGQVGLISAERVLDLPDDRLYEIVAGGPAAVKRAARDLAKADKSKSGVRGSGRREAADPDAVDEREIEGASLRWQSSVESIQIFLISIPRRGGVVNLTRNWTRQHRSGFARQLRTLGETALKAAEELEGALAGPEDREHRGEETPN